MKRWNGWGDDNTDYPLSELAEEYLANFFKAEDPPSDAAIEDVIQSVPDSPFGNNDFINVEPEQRLRHALGQSLPDWINLRSGRIPRFPDGVIFPTSTDEILATLEFAKTSQSHLIPYGGGTSVVGHINPPKSDKPVLTLDLHQFDKLVDFDEKNLLATFEAGITGPQIETELNALGYTLGHFPQSFEYSTLGGWVATRSSGQQSYYYGRIEDLFRGGQLLTYKGELNIPPFPASAAGTDLKQLILGSEGRIGILSEVTVTIKPLPEFEEFYAFFFKEWESGMLAVRQIVQNDIQVSMVRLSDAQETETTLILSGKRNLLRWAGFGLDVLGYRKNRCLLILGITGRRTRTSQALEAASQICKIQGGLYAGKYIGTSWKKSRFRTPYLRNSLWEKGYALDTLETAAPWSKIQQIKDETINAIEDVNHQKGDAILVFGHLSHVYPTGASIYTTYIFKRSPDPDENLERWRDMKEAASKAIIISGGTISHHHGVGRDHSRYMDEEKGLVGVDLISNITQYFDPDGILNPGALIGPKFENENENHVNIQK
jgi:alkyldihydroxyacetonephosphate synthase